MLPHTSHPQMNPVSTARSLSSASSNLTKQVHASALASTRIPSRWHEISDPHSPLFRLDGRRLIDSKAANDAEKMRTVILDTPKNELRAFLETSIRLSPADVENIIKLRSKLSNRRSKRAASSQRSRPLSRSPSITSVSSSSSSDGNWIKRESDGCYHSIKSEFAASPTCNPTADFTYSLPNGMPSFLLYALSQHAPHIFA